MRGCSLVRGHGPMFYIEDELIVELEVIDPYGCCGKTTI